MPEPTPTIHALLIGIDYYKQPNPGYQNLKGCVRDINLVGSHLEKAVKVLPEQIYKLTSPNLEDSALSEVRSALEPGVLPTYKNIVTAFQEITEKAQPKDIVYIHYSGHGGRATTIFPELKGIGQHDEGIVPMDIGEPDGRYLRDVEIATLLKQMTDKGLVVTVILDSCHSGGATRGDCAIRGNEAPDTSDRPKDSLVASREELIHNWQKLTDGTNSTSWAPESKDYVLLAACRPTEVAYEYAVNSKERHGALTHWMIDTLTAIPGTLTYKTLYDRVGAKIQSKFPSQLPMLLGEGDRAVFGDTIVSGHYTVTVSEIDVSQNRVKLNAGLAAGLRSGTRFAIYPLNTDNFEDNQKQLAIVELTELAASYAWARILPEAEGGIATKDLNQLEQGAPAVMLAAPVDLMRQVRLFEKSLGNGENELPAQALVDQQRQALEAVRQALVDSGWVKEVQGEEEGHYQVAINSNGEYEICSGEPIKNLNPILRIDQANAAKEVVKRLIHLTKYQSVQAMDNPASELKGALEFVLLDENKQPFTDQSNLTLQNGTRVYLGLKNVSQESLNVAVLDLEPTWEISQIPLRGIDAPFYQLAPQESIDTPLRFKVPEGKDYEQAKETLKLFATRGPADFRWLKLPSLDQEIKGHSQATRGLKNAFSKLLEAIGDDPNARPSLTRAAVYEPDPKAEWITQQIQITIKH